MKYLTEKEVETIRRGYAIPGLYAASKEKQDEAHKVWMEREAINYKVWAGQPISEWGTAR